MKKILINTFLFFLLSNCCFSPIYSIDDNQNFKIQIESVKGDRLINNQIISKLNSISNDQSENKFNIDINTIYNKTIYSKDNTGATSSYQLDVISEVNIVNRERIEKITVTEKFIMDNNDNTVDEKNYERTIKKTFASSITKQILLKLYSKK